MVPAGETSQKAEVPAKQETKLLANTKRSSWIDLAQLGICSVSSGSRAWQRLGLHLTMSCSQGQQGSGREAGQHQPGVAAEGTWTSLAATLPQPFCFEEEVIKGPAPRGWGHAHTDPLGGQLCPLQAPQAFPNPNPEQVSLAQPHPRHLYSKDPPRVGNSQSMIISGTILTLCRDLRYFQKMN